MANKKKSGQDRSAQKNRDGRRETGSRPEQGRGQQKKKPKGPSRGSGALSVGLGIFGIIWTYTIYRQNGFGGNVLFGFVFIVMCLAHAAYNFRAVSRQEAIERGEIPDEKDSVKTEIAAAGSKRRYPVYRVKSKPMRSVKQPLKRSLKA